MRAGLEEGMVSKRRATRYRSGRSRTWLKIKNPAYAVALTRSPHQRGDQRGGIARLSTLAVLRLMTSSSNGQRVVTSGLLPDHSGTACVMKLI